MAENEKAADIADKNSDIGVEAKANNKEIDKENKSITEPSSSVYDSKNLNMETSAETIDHDATISSVERELAQLHQAQLPLDNNTSDLIDNKTTGSKDHHLGPIDDGEQVSMSKGNDKIIGGVDSKPSNLNGMGAGNGDDGSDIHLGNSESCKMNTSTDTLDLIALLKGDVAVENKTELSHQDNESVEPSDSDLIQGVTIEGEGEYQIMDVVDDPEDVETAATAHEKSDTGSAASKTNSMKAVSNIKKSAPKFTPEEERAMAMEQMATLNSLGGPRRRKQDIKPLAVAGSGLVASIGADWSDDDDASGSENHSSASSSAVKSTGNSKTKLIKNKKPFLQKTDERPSTSKASIEEKNKRPSNTAVVTEVFVLPRLADIGVVKDAPKTQSNEMAKSKSKTSDDEKSSDSSLATGGKRIIKRKIIWDPDAPETQVSYANLVRNSPNLKEEAPAYIAKISNDKQVAVKKIKLTVATKDKKIEKKPVVHSTIPIQTDSEANGTLKMKASPERKDQKPSPPNKRRPQTPVSNGNTATVATTSTIVVKRKRVGEVDRLMGDEGAANMLNSLEKSQATEPDDEKTHKPHMRRRLTTTNFHDTLHKPEQSPSNVATETSSGSGVLNSSGGVTSQPKAKRNTKSKASDSWDYVYKKQKLNEDSMIIRRRSNSSYSSTASLNRSSLDAPPAAITLNMSDASLDDSTEQHVVSKSMPTVKKTFSSQTKDAKSFEFAKPDSKVEKKRNQRSSMGAIANDVAKPNNRRGNNRSPNVDKVTKANRSQSPAIAVKNDSELMVRKIGNVVHIIINASKSKIMYTYTNDLMNNLIKVLDKLENDAECNAVVITTNAPHLCQGLDVSYLVDDSLEVRRKHAEALATTTKLFLKTLATFLKPLIVGVNGKTLGLGVMQLILFDYVIGGDKSIYEAPYVKLGQIPEGFCLWKNNIKILESAKSKLFLLCESMTAAEAMHSGIISKTVATGKVVDEALAMAAKLASMPAEPMKEMKRIAIRNNLDIILNLLDEEFETIVNQWISSDCNDRFRKVKDVGHF